MALFFLGIILGYGAAVPLGPIAIEIARRNLRYGTAHGLALGFGACAADLVYLSLLSTPLAFFLQNKVVLEIIGIIGACVLIWFGYQSFVAKVEMTKQQIQSRSIWRDGFSGLALTLTNPYTILFWAAISGQFILMASENKGQLVFAFIGVFLAVASWNIILNTLVHFTRHKLSKKMILWLYPNYFKNWIFGCAKALRIDYSKPVNINNIGLFTIVDSQELSRCPNPIFEVV